MPENTSKVLNLFISTGDKEMPRLEKERITIDEHGIISDKFYNKDINRSILITSEDSYKIAKENGVDIESGTLGENILIDINPYHLKTGDKIQIAQTVLEVTQNCTLCNGLSKIDSKLPKLLKNDRGIFFRTLIGGEIKKGDSITIL
jgi:MOSC domain-containing protein YiiM